MKKRHILMLYEHNVRELDSLVILKMILKEKNISSEIADIVFTLRKKILKFYAPIILMPFFHTRLDWEAIGGKIQKVYGKKPIAVNMHWEQIGSSSSTSFFVPKDNCSREAIHISWSEDFTKLLTSKGYVKKEKIWEVGNPSADFLNNLYFPSYVNNFELRKKLKIPKNSSIYLVIMSFSNAFVNENYIKAVEKKGGFKNYREYVLEVSKSFKHFAIEIKKLASLLQKENGFLLLRPHPLTPINLLKKFFCDQKNIRVSRKFPLREVIFNSDGIISWLSTGTIDAYIFNKPTVILRPVKFPDKYDIDMFKGFPIVQNYKEVYDLLSQEVRLFNHDILNVYVKRMYGNLDGKNIFRLAEKLIYLIKEKLNDDRINCKILKRKKYYKKLFINYIFKDIPKNVLAKNMPELLPKTFHGRLDDRFSFFIERSLIKKYKIVFESEDFKQLIKKLPDV